MYSPLTDLIYEGTYLYLIPYSSYNPHSLKYAYTHAQAKNKFPPRFFEGNPLNALNAGTLSATYAVCKLPYYLGTTIQYVL